MTEVFVSDLMVVDRRDVLGRLPELARSAEEWFGGPVHLLSLEVSSQRVDGVLRYLASARYGVAVTHRQGGRLGAIARWLGLVQPAVRPPSDPALLGGGQVNIVTEYKP